MSIILLEMVAIAFYIQHSVTVGSLQNTKQKVEELERCQCFEDELGFYLRARLHGSTLWWLKVGKSLQVDLGRFSTIFKRVEAIVMPFVPSLSNK